jgi:hypothetical protein
MIVRSLSHGEPISDRVLLLRLRSPCSTVHRDRLVAD